MVRTQHFYCRDLSSIPGPGTEIPQAKQLSQKEKKKSNSQIRVYAYGEEGILSEEAA